MHAFALELQWDWEFGGWCGPFGWNGKNVGGGALDPVMDRTFSWGACTMAIYVWANII